jgi:hypothetical protein
VTVYSLDGTPPLVRQRYVVIEKELTIIPYPVGFLAGSLAALTATTIATRGRRKRPPVGPDRPGARGRDRKSETGAEVVTP